jgi:lipid II:glycine glycyltransferase (peptidoglycan interpeptide bridge formation enzyme)
MNVRQIGIDWRPDLSVFAKESFLKAVGDEFGWLGGFSGSDELRCILPYTVVRKVIFRMARFRVETIAVSADFGIPEEKEFLNGAMDLLRSLGVDMIIPATTNTIFRTYPDGADAAPYGSYVIDLTQTEEALWKGISPGTRRNIASAEKDEVSVRSGPEFLDLTYRLVRDTFKRSKLPFMSLESFRRYIAGLGENGKILVAEYRGVIQSASVFAFSTPCVYAIYGGNLPEARQGAMKLIQWEAMRHFRSLGVKRFDLVGARIDPAKGSKQESINAFKRYFGATLIRGYMWKYPFRPLPYRLYGLATRVRSGGDIVDAERHKLEGFRPPDR